MEFLTNEEKRKQTIAMGRKRLFKKYGLFLIFIIPCFLAPIPVSIVAFIKDDSKTAIMLSIFFSAIFLLYGGFLLGFMLHKIKLAYEKQVEEKLILNRDHFEYWYTEKKERFCKKIKYVDINDVIYDEDFNTVYVYFDKLELYRGNDERNMRQIIPDRNKHQYRTMPCCFGDENNVLYETLMEELTKRNNL